MSEFNYGDENSNENINMTSENISAYRLSPPILSPPISGHKPSIDSNIEQNLNLELAELSNIMS